MSKSLDNYVGITDVPWDMYGKLMSIPDTVIATYYALATFTPQGQAQEIGKSITEGKIHPKEAKMALARQIVAIYHGEAAAAEAEAAFVAQFQKGEVPEDILTIPLPKERSLAEIMVEQKIAESKTDWRRLVKEGAVSVVGGAKVEAPEFPITTETTLKIGKRRYVRFRD